MITPARAVLAGGALVVLLVLAHVLGHRHEQIASTDRVDNNAFVVVVTPSSRLCQQDEIVPAGTVALRMTIGTYDDPGPRLAFTLTVPDARASFGQRALAVGTLAYGWRQGVVRIPLSPTVHDTFSNATVCIRDHGATKVAIAGSTVLGDYGFSDHLNGQSYAAEVRIDYLLAGRPSWFDMVSSVAYRMTLGKGGYVGWLGWLAPLVLMLGAVAVLARVVLRLERES